jgi:hypothetical protein
MDALDKPFLVADAACAVSLNTAHMVHLFRVRGEVTAEWKTFSIASNCPNAHDHFLK